MSLPKSTMDTEDPRLNHVRMEHLINKVALKAVRKQFSTYFPSNFPGEFSKILHREGSILDAMKRGGSINPAEWNQLFPSIGQPIPERFPLSLMIRVLDNVVLNRPDKSIFQRNAIQSVTHIPSFNQRLTFPIHAKKDQLPPDDDKTIRADLMRINWMDSYLKQNSRIPSDVFEQFWIMMKSSIRRLGGLEFELMCNEVEKEELQTSDVQNAPGLSKNIKDALKTIMLDGTYLSYENRIYLAGPCKAGKTSLACILVGNDIPKTWSSTNGLSIFYGRNTIDIKRKFMRPYEEKDEIDGEKFAPCDIIDFGGQEAFDMIHQLFISQRGTFCFMFDGRKNLSDKLHEGSSKTTGDVLMHWNNMILTYCDSQNRGFPKIHIVATHRDHFNEDEIEERRATLVSQIDAYVGLHTLRHHIIYERLLFINTQEIDDKEVELLKTAFVETAFLQPSWGEKTPLVWRHLQQQLSKQRNDGKKIISKEEFEKINKEAKHVALDEKGITVFLKTQHSFGKIMYFDTGSLKNVIIIDPLYMVAVLRSFITDRLFWPEEGDLVQIHENLETTGILRKSHLFRLWEQDEYKIIQPHKEEVCKILVRLDILVPPKDYQKESENDEESSDYFFVPCIVKHTNNTDYMDENCTKDRSICLTYAFNTSIVIPSFSYRLFGACLSMWECKTYKGRKMIFRESVTVIFDSDHEITLQVVGSKINTVLVHRSFKEQIERSTALSIQECVTDTLERILLFYEGIFGGSIRFQQRMSLSLFSFEFKLPCGEGDCFAPEFARRLTEESSWICENNTLHPAKWLLLWFPRQKFEEFHHEEKQKVIPDEYDCSTPSNQQLRRFIVQFTKDDFRNLMMNLNMDVSRIEQIFYEHRHLHDAMFYCMWNWKITSPEPSISILASALENAELSKDFLLKMFVECSQTDTGVPQMMKEAEPPDNFLHKLARYIGRETFQLAIELDIPVEDYENIEYSCDYKNLPDQAFGVLRLWKQSKQNPTIEQLAVALSNINRDVKTMVQLLVDTK